MYVQVVDLSVEVERAEGAAAVVRVDGELDKVTAPAFRECLTALSAEGRLDVVIDASRLTFCDSSGLWVLVAHRRDVGALGGSLRLTGVHGVFRRVLDVTGLKAAFDSVLPVQL
ncbi:STAS domain-containing protein [Nonomuraea sp. LPB2021202275-12-8]|uniref:STAS domain-containing protein n=1 Tax=Nonomuraea sp. LPB2021202275-12-8 TaxID=3120159 RepID=UPI00300C6AFF